MCAYAGLLVDVMMIVDPSHFNILMNFLCLTARSGMLAKTFVRVLIACLKASQLDADAVEPNNTAVARLYNSSAMKPKAPVESLRILGYLKHALTFARPRRIVAVGQLMRVL